MGMRKIGSRTEVLAFIAAFRDEHGYSPTVREIAAHYDMSPTAAHATLRRMLDEGLLRMPSGIPRAITISGVGMKMMTEEMT